MTQHFIKLGEGYGDVYELITLIEAMPMRVKHLLVFHTKKKGETKTSIAVIFKPTSEGNFLPIYISLEGIPGKESNRFKKFQSVSEKLNLPIIEMDVPPSDTYYEEELYYQQLISILRLNHLLPPI